MGARKKAKKAPETFHVEEREGPTGMGDDMRNLGQEIINSFDARVARVKALKHETAAMLKGFQDDLRQKAADLKKFLSNAEASRMGDFQAMHQGIRARQEERSRETAEMMKGFNQENQQRAREVGNMLGGFHREQEAMAGHWRNMTATMEGKRAGKH